ncbi:ImmA/IrrE family metallo-endopeptidase [Candidatus Poriferisodalis sp.]|uniref:ImmA/IrrE family metallo-endopeptidase n=1 Tax=Candidatus Poriferisodalis sp. TaxID=3101277 RepID=UPI003B029065
MSALQFEVQWQDGAGIEGPELAATFASLRILAAESVLTRVDDKRAQTLRDVVYVPVYPLAEWLVSNWWFLAYEPENLLNRDDPAFAHRHRLVTGSDGYAYPDLRLSSAGKLTRLEWERRASEWTRLDYRSSGSATLDRDQVLTACTDFVDMVMRRLSACGISSSYLQSEWEAVQTTEHDEQAFCATAASLGRDPYDLDEREQSLVLDVGTRLGDLRTEALPALDPADPLAACIAIHEAMEASKSNTLRLADDLVGASRRQVGTDRPWLEGYELARDTRAALGLNGEALATNANLAAAIGQHPASISRATRPVKSLAALTLVDGVVNPQRPGTVAIGLSETGLAGRRFLFCRALAEVLTAGTATILTKARTERQQRNRAFAAEFLAPSASLRDKIADRYVDHDHITELADEFGVSPYVIEHQLQNHGIAELVS